MIALKLKIKPDSKEVTRFLGELDRGLVGTDRKDFFRYVAVSVAEASRDHVRALVPTRHATARALGAQSTRHLTKAADGIEGHFDQTRAMLVFARVSGLSRAFRTFRLKPVTPGIRYLTIPASARSYGRRAREFSDLKFGMAEWTKDGRSFMRRALIFPDGTTAYWLLTKANIPQDRTLLPSDDDFARAAEIGARGYIKAATTA